MAKKQDAGGGAFLVILAILVVILMALAVLAPVILVIVWAVHAFLGRNHRSRFGHRASAKQKAIRSGYITLRNAGLGGLIAWCLVATIYPLVYGGVPLVDWFTGVRIQFSDAEQAHSIELIFWSAAAGYIVAMAMGAWFKARVEEPTDEHRKTISRVDGRSGAMDGVVKTQGGNVSTPDAVAPPTAQFCDPTKAQSAAPHAAPGEAPSTENIPTPPTSAFESFAAKVGKKTPVN